MSDETSASTSFLNAEEAAAKLVEALGRLEKTVSIYEDASGTLSTVGESVQSLSVAVSDTSQKASDAIEAIRSVGSPAIIVKLSKLDETVQKALLEMDSFSSDIAAIYKVQKELAEHVLDVQKIADERMGELRDQVSNVVEQSEGLSTVIAELGAEFRKSFEKTFKRTDAAKDEMLNKLGVMTEESQKNAEQNAQELKKIKMFALSAVIVAAVAVVMPFIAGALFS